MLLLNAIIRKAGLNLESHTPLLSLLWRSIPVWQQSLQDDKQSAWWVQEGRGAQRKAAPRTWDLIWFWIKLHALDGCIPSHTACEEI